MTWISLVPVLCVVAALAGGCASSKRFQLVNPVSTDVTPHRKKAYPDRVTVDIPAGEASNAMVQCARQTGMHVSFPADEASGVSIRARQGVFEDPEDDSPANTHPLGSMSDPEETK